MHAYPILAVVAVVTVVVVELAWLRTGVFGRVTYWISMVIVLGFQVPVDGWMAKLSDPIVIYNRNHISGIRFPFDIPIEEFAYGFALVTFAIILWERTSRDQQERDRIRL